MLAFLDCSSGARILAIVPIPGRSHFIVFSSLARELAARGHQVTMMSVFPQKTPIANYTDIPLADEMSILGGSNFFDFGSVNPMVMMLALWGLGNSLCDTMLSQREVRKLINSEKDKFDAVIVEAFFNECFYAFAHKFKAPLIQYSVYGGNLAVDDSVGNPTQYSHVPDAMLNYGDHMTFCERLKNALFSLYSAAGRYLYYIPEMDAIMRKHFNDSTLPYLSDIEKSTALLLVNNHVAVGFPRPLVPNYINVGGLHIKPPKKLPEDMEKFIDGARDGVIYFSMGSNLMSSHFPEEKRKALLEAFASLKQKVLWKWEEDSLPGQPPNVRLGKWMPQSDILAHKNVRLFITHGGLMSTQEAVYHGVPVIGIPVYGDQELNMVRAEAAGFGVRISYSNITKEAISWAIEEIISQPRYKENAKRLSSIFRDNPQSPMDTAVYWTEYVIRHKGAPHLRSAALDLSWYQYHLLDVLAVLLGAVVLVLLVTAFVLRALYRKLFHKTTSSPKKKSKKRD
ncbi:UDP-glycosyltransferase UGT5 [Anabrus simplex]|uniref:UDP-glycosyltransferase UGT5 n=1 Tax=Anabrus simplex TaxID=316456 RepID=UPI0035A301B9